MKNLSRAVILFTIIISILSTACASRPDPRVKCTGRQDPNYVSGMRGNSCGAPVPCYHLTEAERKKVPRCQRWEDKPLLERIALRVIYWRG